LFGGIIGGGGGGSGGLWMGVGKGTFHSVAMALGLWAGAIGSAYFLARTIFKRQVRSRREALRALALELADQARDAVRVLPRAR
jgi:hypothetical protein